MAWKPWATGAMPYWSQASLTTGNLGLAKGSWEMAVSSSSHDLRTQKRAFWSFIITSQLCLLDQPTPAQCLYFRCPPIQLGPSEYCASSLLSSLFSCLLSLVSISHLSCFSCLVYLCCLVFCSEPAQWGSHINLCFTVNFPLSSLTSTTTLSIMAAVHSPSIVAHPTGFQTHNMPGP